MSVEAYRSILESLPQCPQPSHDSAYWHGFWVNTNDEEIMCPYAEAADALADLFEDCGVGVMRTHYYNEDKREAVVNEDCYGWWSVYIDE